MNKAKRNVRQSIAWWWKTRVQSLWTVLIPSLLQKSQKPESKIEFSSVGSAVSTVPADGITVILTHYKRGQYLPMQVEAIRNQSVKPSEIWLWCNEAGEDIPDYSALVDRVIVSNSNYKFWGRFAFAMLAQTEYVAIFDDDILPEKNWLKNCLDTVASGCDGILGGSGVILPEDGGYSSKHKVGWNGHLYNTPTEVDAICQCWFARRSHFQYMWHDTPHSWENGEDIHLGCHAYMHGGIKCYVPPHPEKDPTLWSCRPDFGKRVSKIDPVHKQEDHHSIRDDIVDTYRKKGWKIVATR